MCLSPSDACPSPVCPACPSNDLLSAKQTYDCIQMLLIILDKLTSSDESSDLDFGLCMQGKRVALGGENR